MTAWTRIALRYLAAYLVGKGLLPGDVGEVVGTDPDIVIGVEALLGILLGAAVEGWYVLAKRMGWRT